MPSAEDSLDNWLAYIDTTHHALVDLGLDRVRQVYEALSIDKPAPQIVVVAGTNGKGSTIAALSALLERAGHTYGAYTSPHIERFNERLVINGQMSSDQDWVEALCEIDRCRGDVALTYFEFTTLAAFLILGRSQLDVCILEIGLGGRMDAVNLLDGDVAIITSIGLDHTDWLGDTLDKIGFEKAGVARPGRPLLLGSDMPQSVYAYASEVGAKALSRGADFDIDFGTSIDQFRWTPAIGEMALASSAQCANDEMLSLHPNSLALAWQAFVLLDRIHIDPSQLTPWTKVLRSAHLSGRFERIALAHSSTTVFADVAHNTQAVEHLVSRLNGALPKNARLSAVFSAYRDKDIASVVRCFDGIVETWYIAALAGPRSVPVEELSEIVGLTCDNVLSFESVEQAFSAAVSKQDSQTLSVQPRKADWVVCFGSFGVVEAVKQCVRRLQA